MLNIILNIIGISLIIYSIYIIKKDIKDNKYRSEELYSIEKNTRKYYEDTEDIVSSFDKLVDLKLDTIKSEEHRFQNKDQIYEDSEETKFEKDINQSQIKNLNLNKESSKIIELVNLGLTSEEIAKKLKKGVREVDIVIKMHEKKF